MHPVFWISDILLTALFAAVLELNRNTLAGWLLLVIVAVLWTLFYRLKFVPACGFAKFLWWIGYIALFAGILFLTWPPVRAVGASDDPNPRATEAVRTDKGLVSGVYSKDGEVEIYAGIPYAKPPVGELRWRAPQDPEPWDGILECSEFAPMSMQVQNLPIYESLARIIGYHDYRISLKDNWIPPVSEDSLYLNVWKPAGEQKNLPVLVYIHGGSLQTGQPWYSDYNGSSFAEDGVVCVNMGYRLGVFGFLADEEMLALEGTTGNYGLLDQIKALEWVRDNIAAFGGDPSDVTIVGESAGSVCVDALCVSPLANGLFRRAVLESSTLACVNPPHSYRTFEDALKSGLALKARYGASDISALRKLDAKKLAGEMNSQHHVTVDGHVLPDSPYNLRKAGVHNEQAILHGYNSEESGPFIIFGHANMKNYEKKVRAYFRDYADDVLALYPAKTDEEADRYWARIYGAVFFDYPHYCLNRLAAGQGIPVYEYLFSKDNGSLGAWHSGELIYAFGRIPGDSKLFDQADRSLSARMHADWVSFAKTGNPGFEPNPTSARLMEFGDNIGMIDEPTLAFYAIMDRMQGFGK